MKNIAAAYFVVLTFATLPCSGRTITVDDDAPADFNNIQAAINDATMGDTIEIQPGTYTGEGNRDIDFLGKAITVTGTDPDDPETVATTIIDCDGTAMQPHRGFIFVSGETYTSVLTGLTIINGYGPDTDIDDYTRSRGGGIHCNGSSPIITKCAIAHNYAETRAGGIDLCYSNALIDNCILKENYCDFSGGALYTQGSNAEIVSCTITSNIAESGGGLCNAGGEIKVVNSVFAANDGGFEGGAITSWSGSPRIIGCAILDNIAGWGGGVCNEGLAFELTNCTLRDNIAWRGGGAVRNSGIFDYAANVLIRNSILWNNQALVDGGSQILFSTHEPGSVINIDHSIVQGGQADVRTSGEVILNWGQGNIDADPSFILSGDYHIRAESPCIDAGFSSIGYVLPPTDIDGNPRITNGGSGAGSIIDIGAHEYNTFAGSLIVSERELEFVGLGTGWLPNPQTLLIGSGNGGALEWSISEDCEWLMVSPTSGTAGAGMSELQVFVDSNGLLPGTYTCHLTIDSGDAVNAPQAVRVSLSIVAGSLGVPADFATIQEAVDHVIEGGFVIVADGTYVGPGNRGIDFRGKAITVRSENGPEACIIDCQGQDRAFIFQNGEDANSVLEGFTITNGSAEQYGGAIYCDGNASAPASPTLRNCIFTANSARYGGAIRCEDSASTISGCVFTGNFAEDYGGALSCSSCDLTILNCSFENNRAERNGGAINGSVNLTDCTFIGNYANWSGGAVVGAGSIRGSWFENNSAGYDGGAICESCSIVDCVIMSNQARYGGGIYGVGGGGGRGSGEPSLECYVFNCRIIGNTAERGGGVYGTGSLASSILKGNSAESWGGAIHLADTVANCTIVGNTAGTSGGGIATSRVITNSIVRGNAAPEGAQICTGCYEPVSYPPSEPPPATISYCNVEGGRGGVSLSLAEDVNWLDGNIDVDPHFADSTDYHLAPTSPCINRGDPNYSSIAEERDIDGQPRIINRRVDIGADEADYDGPIIGFEPAQSEFFIPAGSSSGASRLTIYNAGTDELNWSITSDCAFLHLSANAGICIDEANEIEITVDTAGLTDPCYVCELLISATGALNNPQTASLKFYISELIYVPDHFPTIQDAIDFAWEGATIVLRDGIYRGPGNREIDFQGKVITLRSENGPADCLIDCQSVARAFHFQNGEDANSVLDGLAITNGYAFEGGGILCTDGSSPTIANCIITDNAVLAPMCNIVGCAPGGIGGGICSIDSSPTVVNCFISGNYGGDGGGGIHGPVTVVECTIAANSSGLGGGVHCTTGGHVSITRSTIIANSAGRGGGLFCETPPSFLDPCLPPGQDDTQVEISNCLIVENEASYGAGLFGYCKMSTCTITENIADYGGGGVFVEDFGPELANCILWGNRDRGTNIAEAQIRHAYSTSGNAEAVYCCIEGWTSEMPGAGNIGDDPLFTLDFHLRADSPCIDAGDPNYAAIGQMDIDSEQRPHGDRVDIGWDEFIDSDHDGLPDFWELLYFGSATAAFPNDNPDNDLWPNIDEYVLNSDPFQAQRQYFVDPIEGSDLWDGLALAWDGEHGPKATIQAAIDEVSYYEDAQVILAPGTYTGYGNRDIDFRGKALTLQSADPNDPQIVASTVIDCAGSVYDWHRAFDFHTSETHDSIVAGLTIVNGYAPSGGAIRCYDSSPTISNCILTGNRADRCYIPSDSSYSYGGSGGAVWASNSDLVIHNCVIEDSYAEGWGGGLNVFAGSPVILNCVITENTAGGGGGGLDLDLSSEDYSIIANCTISHNTAGGDGGGIFNWEEGSISNCRIFGNSAGEYGGGIYGEGEFTNCTITGNKADLDGGGMWVFETILRNCTIAGNRARGSGGAIACPWEDPIVSNCIVWGNESQSDEIDLTPRDLRYPHAHAQNITYSTIAGGLAGVYIGEGCDSRLVWGLGNLDTDAHFVDPGYWDANGTPEDASDDFWIEGDYHLKSEGWRWDARRSTWTWDEITSRSIDGGDPNSPLDDEPLFVSADPKNEWGENKRINMGAYGGTREASIPPLGWAVRDDYNGDGIVNFTDLACWSDASNDLSGYSHNAFPDLASIADSWLEQTSWFQAPAPGPVAPDLISAQNPTPPDGAVNVSSPVVLSWEPVPGAYEYIVYYGSDPPQYQSRTDEASFTPYYAHSNRTYYWRIDAVTPCGLFYGPMWSFTTSANP